MNAKELREKYPDLFAQVRDEGVAAGEAAERQRCSDHLRVGEAAGCMDLAVAAILDGSTYESMRARYDAAAISAAAARRAADDSKQVESVIEGQSSTPASGDGDEEKVHAAVTAYLRGEL